MSDLQIARLMHWRYEDVQALPLEAYEVMIELLNREAGTDVDHG